jgi:uroporphyrinogen decarboxylase
MNLFQNAIRKENYLRPPVWFMRQAGRYHAHYQQLRKKHSFVDLCKVPELACETTLGPIQDFDFDAAILFSDLLFPLEVMGMGLRYEVGPQLDWHLRELSDLTRLQSGGALAKELSFQADALKLIRNQLPQEKGLLGFVGGPLTLFCYAVEGSHQGNLESFQKGLQDGRFDGFFEKLVDLLVENMVLQAEAGADCVAVLDTCAGEVEPIIYQEIVVPRLKALLDRFVARAPNTPIVYYSKGTGPDFWKSLTSLPIAGLGIDWKHSLVEVLTELSGKWAIQGNIDPHWLFLQPAELEHRLQSLFESIQALPKEFRRGWICGLGHGVLPGTPESNVRLFLELQRKSFSEV